jgi:hypothetical protein
MIVLFGAVESRADPDAFAQRLFSNMSDEAATCGSYFFVTSQCLANTQTAESQQMSRNFDGLADSAYIRALAYADLAGMKQEAAIAAAKLSQQEMWQQIGNNCANIAILNLEHLQMCTAVMQDPDERATYWRNRLQQD